MKTRLIASILLIIILLPGCLVKSLHPFYTDQDVVYKKELTGTWIDHDSAVWIITRHQQVTGLMKPPKPGPSYDIMFTDQKGVSKFNAHLFTLNGQLYLDFLPTEVSCGNDLAAFHLVGTHSLAKVDLKGGKININWYNEEWLVDLFNKNRIRIAHERVPYDDDQKDPESMQVVLTAPTADLQKFITKYGSDPEAFKREKPGENANYGVVLSRKSS